MDDPVATADRLLQRATDGLTGHPKRPFQAAVAVALCGGTARQAERRFGWGRDAVDNRMGYRLVRVRKGRPLKTTAATDALFANLAAVREQAEGDRGTLEVSVGTTAQVADGAYVRGGRHPDGV